MPYARALAFALLLAVSILFVSPVQWLARRFDWPLHRRIQVGFCRAACAVIGVRIDARGATLPGRAPRLLVSNHVSWSDIIVLAALHPLTFLAKSEVSSWPVLGFLARLQGTVFVERGNRKAIPLVNAALTRELAAGRDLVIFAEGTSSDGTRVLEFKSAHFPGGEAMAEADLAPVALRYCDSRGASVDVGWYGDMTFLPHLWRLMKRDDLVCRVAFGDLVAPQGHDRKALAAALHEKVSGLLEGMRAADERV